MSIYINAEGLYVVEDRKFSIGDTIELRPANECTVIFIGEI
jgi:hypothetical protein